MSSIPSIGIVRRNSYRLGGDDIVKRRVISNSRVCDMNRIMLETAVREVARHVHNPAARHWVVCRVIVSWKTKDLGVVFRRGRELKTSFHAIKFSRFIYFQYYRNEGCELST